MAEGKASTVDVDAVMEGVESVSVSTPLPTKTTSSSSVPPPLSPTLATSTSPSQPLEHPYSMHGRVVLSRVLALGREAIGREIVAGGWVKTGRVQGKGAFCFLELNDGSTPKNLQCHVTSEVHDIKPLTATGTCLLLRGTLEATPDTATTPVELKVTEVLYIGPCDASTYPVAKTRLSLEHLRSVIHLRARTNTIAAVTRIRNALAAATHRFFQERGFMYCHTPLVTASDCEGAGEMFQVRQENEEGGFPERQCTVTQESPGKTSWGMRDMG